MNLIDIEDGLREAVKKIEDIGIKYAEAKGLSWALQEQKKIVLAGEMNKIQAKTESAKEREALVSEVYQTHVKATMEAIINEGKLKATRDRWCAQYEALRSMLSMEKTKLKTEESLTHLGD